MVRKNQSFVTKTKVIVNYADAFEIELGVWFVDARVKEIVDDKMSPGYLPPRKCMTPSVHSSHQPASEKRRTAPSFKEADRGYQPCKEHWYSSFPKLCFVKF